MTPRHLLEPGRLAGSALLKAQSDDRLVDMTRAGNDRAFEAIVERYHRPLLRYCSRILPDGRGEDAVQQVFINAYDALHGDVGPKSLKAWLYGIAHNVSVNILRRGSHSDGELALHRAAGEPTEDTIERRERFHEVMSAVAALPAGQRDALLLRELEGRGHEEIARELGVTGGAARQLISRARNGIRSAAANFLPLPLVTRLTDGTASPPTTARIAELTAAGGGLTVVKVVATVAVSGTLVGGGTKAPDILKHDKDGLGGDVAAAAPSEKAAASTKGQPGDGGAGEAANAARDRHDRRRGRRAGEDGRDDDRSGPSGHGGGDREDDDHDERSGGDDDDGRDHDDSSGRSGNHDHEGDDGDDESGSGARDEPDELAIDADNSGPGSGEDEPDDDSSGSGSSGSSNDDEPELPGPESDSEH